MSQKKTRKLELPRGCIFCLSPENNEEKLGQLIIKDGITVHYFCLLFASGLSQNGADKEGLLGFLREDILKEHRRTYKLRCTFCKGLGAAIGCMIATCHCKFHFGCGMKNGTLYRFYDNYSSLCREHRSDLSPVTTRRTKCLICLNEIRPQHQYNTIRASCCTNGIYHRHCIQRQSNIAGLHFFRCPLCNCKKAFQQEMLERGIYIPDRDAKWEMEPNAYHELSVRHDRCDIQPCKCPGGRKLNKLNSKYELMLCDRCGSSGTHLICSALDSPLDDWMCSDCLSIDKKTKPSAEKCESPKPQNMTSYKQSPLSCAQPKHTIVKRKLSSFCSRSRIRKSNVSVSPREQLSSCSHSRVQKSNMSVNPRARLSSKSKRKKNQKRINFRECPLMLSPARSLPKPRQTHGSLRAQSAAQSLPQPRQTRRSSQARSYWHDIPPIDLDSDSMPPWLKSLYKEDFFTGKNMGDKNKQFIQHMSFKNQNANDCSGSSDENNNTTDDATPKSRCTTVRAGNYKDKPEPTTVRQLLSRNYNVNYYSEKTRRECCRSASTCVQN